MPAPTNPPVLTTTRDPVRRVFHALLAMGGWILFVYTWWAVFRPGLDQGSIWIFAGIAVTFGVIVLANHLWVIHNLSIFRTRPRRVHVRAVDPVVTHDALGRSLDVDWPATRRAARIVIEIPVDDRKVYAIPDATEGRGDAGMLLSPVPGAERDAPARATGGMRASLAPHEREDTA